MEAGRLSSFYKAISKISILCASSIQHKERKCTNKKVVLEKKKPKSRSNELYVNLFFDAVQPTLYTNSAIPLFEQKKVSFDDFFMTT